MAALTKDRNTPNKELGRSISLRVAAATQIFGGSQVALDDAGFAIPATDVATGSKVIGVADEEVDNSGGAAGDLRVLVRKGVFGFVNDTNVVQADIGEDAMVVDDQTVTNAATATNDKVVGTIDDIDDDDGFVYVKIHEHN